MREHGSARKAEAQLAEREKRIDKPTIRELDPVERERFSKQWEAVQARGYPVSEFDQRAADMSVDHPRVVENYRAAHDLALRVGKNEASTDDLRVAMIHYRSLFQDLVQAVVTAEQRAVA